jgi:hypothetical protein
MIVLGKLLSLNGLQNRVEGFLEYKSQSYGRELEGFLKDLLQESPADGRLGIWFVP